MIVVYNDKKYVVKWKHNRLQDYIQTERIIHTKGGSTECSIQEGFYPDSVKIGSGLTRCSDKDTYSKKIGRKLSLNDLLCRFDRNFRKTVWETYFKECK